MNFSFQKVYNPVQIILDNNKIIGVNNTKSLGLWTDTYFSFKHNFNI